MREALGFQKLIQCSSPFGKTNLEVFDAVPTATALVD